MMSTQTAIPISDSSINVIVSSCISSSLECSPVLFQADGVDRKIGFVAAALSGEFRPGAVFLVIASLSAGRTQAHNQLFGAVLEYSGVDRIKLPRVLSRSDSSTSPLRRIST